MPERIRRAMILTAGRCRSGIFRISQGGARMKIQKIRELARHQGLDPGKAEKSRVDQGDPAQGRQF
jgi:hypothetical protein